MHGFSRVHRPTSRCSTRTVSVALSLLLFLASSLRSSTATRGVTAPTPLRAGPPRATTTTTTTSSARRRRRLPNDEKEGTKDKDGKEPVDEETTVVALPSDPTDAPATSDPTRSPTTTTTKSPTDSPTTSPTDSPTKSPTDSPTNSPVAAPRVRSPTSSPRKRKVAKTPAPVVAVPTAPPTATANVDVEVSILVRHAVEVESSSSSPEQSRDGNNDDRSLRRKRGGGNDRVQHDNYVAVDATVSTMSALFDQEPYFRVRSPSYGDQNSKDDNDNNDRRLVLLAPAFEFSRYLVTDVVEDPTNGLVYHAIKVTATFKILDYALYDGLGDSQSGERATADRVRTTARDLLDASVTDGVFLRSARMLDGKIVAAASPYSSDDANETLLRALPDDVRNNSAKSALKEKKRLAQEYEPMGMRTVGVVMLMVVTVLSTMCYVVGKRRFLERERRERQGWVLSGSEHDLDAILDKKVLGMEDELFEGIMQNYNKKEGGAGGGGAHNHDGHGDGVAQQERREEQQKIDDKTID